MTIAVTRVLVKKRQVHEDQAKARIEIMIETETIQKRTNRAKSTPNQPNLATTVMMTRTRNLVNFLFILQP